MSRALVDYTAPQASAIVSGFNPDEPVAGHYRFRMVSGGVAVAVRIWFGLPIDPTSGDEMDRAPTWNATVNGAWVELERVWPSCADQPITEAEAAHLTGLQRWGADHGHGALADPRRRLSPLHSPLLF